MSVTTPTPSKVQARIDLLEEFLKASETWLAYDPEVPDSSKMDEAQKALRFINRNLAAARAALVDSRLISDEWAPTLLDDLVRGTTARSPKITHLINQAIGFYDHINRNTGLISSEDLPQAFDIEGAIHRALRVSFRRARPSSEKDVQDAIEVILRAIGAPFTREQETAPAGAHTYRPDFALGSLNLALEVKFTNEKHSASKAQEEISSDIIGYRTRWKRLLFVIYDCGAIDDPTKLVTENSELFGTYGVSILIVKH